MSERWKPGNGEHYYYFYYDGDVDSDVWRNDLTDRQLFERGNCFRTEAEAEAAAEKVKALLLSLHCDESLQDKQLPKLTAEVFNRPDCPEWAQYAAVDEDGSGYWYGELPFVGAKVWRRGDSSHLAINTGILWDASNWQNILIERPAVLPDWCKPGEWVWVKSARSYEKIEAIEDRKVVCGMVFFDSAALGKTVMQTRLRPYNAEEMKALVGKVVEDKDGNFYLVVCYIPRGRGLLIGGFYFNEQEIIDAGFTIDGKPCGKLEHLENGEWVK